MLQNLQCRCIPQPSMLCSTYGLGVQTVHRDLKAAREEAQAQEQSFQRELSSAQKLSDMYKEMANARIHKCESLEGVLRELKTHLEVWLRLYCT